jgi:large subunit ribosomal protein L20
MARIANSVTTHKRHKKILTRAKGFYSANSTNYKTARQAVRKAMAHSTRDRKQRQRRMRRLWIMRINAASRMFGVSYSKLINGLKNSNILMDRKVLADLAVRDISMFEEIVKKACV